MSQAAEHLADKQGTARRGKESGSPEAKAKEVAEERIPAGSDVEGYATKLDLREHRAETREAIVDIRDHTLVIEDGQRRIRAEIRNIGKRTMDNNELLRAKIGATILSLREDFNSKYDVLTNKFNGLNDKFNVLSDKFNGLNAQLVEIKGEVLGLKARFDGVDSRISHINSSISHIKWLIGGMFALLSFFMAMLGLSRF